MIGLRLSIEKAESEEGEVHSGGVVGEEGTAFLCEFDDAFHVGNGAGE